MKETENIVKIKEAENIVKIEGILSEIDLKQDTSKKDNKPYISGKIVVRVKQEISGEQISADIPVFVFATKFTKKQTINPAYESIAKLLDGSFVSIAACGDESKADCVRIDRGSIVENAFYGQTGSLFSEGRVRASFISKVKQSEVEHTAAFQNVIVIGKISDEVDKQQEPTGRMEIHAIIPQYGDKVDLVKFIVASKPAMDHIKSAWEQGQTVRVFGKLRFTSSTTYVTEEVGFGEPITNAKTTSVREFVITSGSLGGFDEDQAYKGADIKKALSERQARLNEMKERASAPAPAPAAANFANDLGF